MLTGLTRELRWRDVADELPQKVQYLLVAHLTPDYNSLSVGDRVPMCGDVPRCRSAYWNGREFMTTESPYYPLHTVTHWMPYPETPDVDDMRRVYAEVVGGA